MVSKCGLEVPLGLLTWNAEGGIRVSKGQLRKTGYTVGAVVADSDLFDF